MAKGKVKWYNVSKGYGFITDEDGKDIFVHHTGLDASTKRLEQEQDVEFETRDGEKGPVAMHVKITVDAQ